MRDEEYSELKLKMLIVPESVKWPRAWQAANDKARELGWIA